MCCFVVFLVAAFIVYNVHCGYLGVVHNVCFGQITNFECTLCRILFCTIWVSAISYWWGLFISCVGHLLVGLKAFLHKMCSFFTPSYVDRP